MNDQDVKAAFQILKRGTIVVKVIPFVLAVFYTLCLVAYMFTSDNTQTWLDMFFYISPMTVLSNLLLSKIFKMCVWHRIECLLPIIPQISVFIDLYIPLSEIAATINAATICIMFFLSIINAYFTFIRR